MQGKLLRLKADVTPFIPTGGDLRAGFSGYLGQREDNSEKKTEEFGVHLYHRWGDTANDAAGHN